MNVIRQIAEAWLEDTPIAKKTKETTHDLGMSWYCLGFIHGLTRNCNDNDSFNYRYLLIDIDNRSVSIADDDPNWRNYGKV